MESKHLAKGVVRLSQMVLPEDSGSLKLPAEKRLIVVASIYPDGDFGQGYRQIGFFHEDHVHESSPGIFEAQILAQAYRGRPDQYRIAPIDRRSEFMEGTVVVHASQLLMPAAVNLKSLGVFPWSPLLLRHPVHC